jgi:3-hydroxyisobutyrate dehydrogenase-like beta-hydroxyacid dehydrogenase
MAEIGFIGLGHMGFQMARRLIEAEHQLVVFDTRQEVVNEFAALGARAASSPRQVADHAETVLASLPSLQASLEVATGADGIIAGQRVERFVDLSTVGAQLAERISARLATRDIVAIDCPVSGGVAGAQRGTLALMVSGPAADVDVIRPLLDVLGNVFFIGEKPGSAQTMKLANNLLAATSLAATSEAVVMGVKAGLDPAVMIEVFNAGSGATHASRDKFPRAILPRTFDYGFATGLMVKDVRLCLQEAQAAGLSMEIAEAVGRLWELVLRETGPESDFTSVIKPIEAAAGVVVGVAVGTERPS